MHLCFFQKCELSRLGGSNLAKTVNTILKILMKDEVAKRFTYLGTAEKKQFSSLEICKLVAGMALFFR